MRKRVFQVGKKGGLASIIIKCFTIIMLQTRTPQTEHTQFMGPHTFGNFYI